MSSDNNGEEKSRRRGPRVLLGVTGSVAAVKSPEIAVRLANSSLHAQVKVLLSSGGQNFWDKAIDYDTDNWNRLQSLLSVDEKEGGGVQVHSAEEEWQHWNRLGDPVLHIDLRNWADILLIAPLSAHTLAKLAHGLCDDTLSCVARAWDYGHDDGVPPGKPVLLAPAMNTAMWEHPLTAQQLATIQTFWKQSDDDDDRNGIQVIEPMSKTLACGEVGVGALAPVDSIVEAVERTWKGIAKTR